MSEPLPEREVARIAALARLALTPDESGPMAAQLGRILAFAAEVASVDTGRVPHEAAAFASGPCERADESKPSMGAFLALANAPETAAQLFVTPRVLPRD